MVDGPESIDSAETASAEPRESIQQIIAELSRQIESIKSTETGVGASQFGEQISSILEQSLEQIEATEFDGCISSLTDASDFAYQQSGITGFESLGLISDQIDLIIKTVKKLSAGL